MRRFSAAFSFVKVSGDLEVRAMPLWTRSAAFKFGMSSPSKRIVPESWREEPANELNYVVLPAPLGPNDGALSPFLDADGHGVRAHRGNIAEVFEALRYLENLLTAIRCSARKPRRPPEERTTEARGGEEDPVSSSCSSVSCSRRRPQAPRSGP